ncbi:hypothetical protein TWF718_005264 [Orbilia javanica]|uniref:Uncharacterized protein n=1 Tax=Orbilia javanica TaxID=47235 RepID=A0AAN8RJ99_9PEZI
MCKTHSGKFICGHKVVDIRNGCPTPQKCKNFLKKEYTIQEACTRCAQGTKDTERDKLVMKKRRTVTASHERIETTDGPRECEIEVVPCTSGMEINFGLNKEQKKAKSESGSGSGGSSWGLPSLASLGGFSPSDGSPGKEPRAGREKCDVM